MSLVGSDLDGGIQLEDVQLVPHEVHNVEGNKRHGEAGKVLAPPGHKAENRTLGLLDELRSGVLELRDLLSELVNSSASDGINL